MSKPQSPNAVAAVATLETAMSAPGVPPQPTGIQTLDAALKDPAAREAIATETASAVAIGGAGGVVLGAVGGALVVGLAAWALWPKRKGTR